MPYWLMRTAAVLDAGRPLDETALLETGLFRSEALAALVLVVMRQTTVYTDRRLVGDSGRRPTRPLFSSRLTLPADKGISLFQRVQLFVGKLFHVNQFVAGRMVGADQFIQLEVERFGIAVLGVLYEEDNKKRDNRCAGVDDQLPGIGKAKVRTENRPRHNHRHGQKEHVRTANQHGRLRREAAEPEVNRIGLLYAGSYLDKRILLMFHGRIQASHELDKAALYFRAGSGQENILFAGDLANRFWRPRRSVLVGRLCPYLGRGCEQGIERFQPQRLRFKDAAEVARSHLGDLIELGHFPGAPILGMLQLSGQ